MATQRLSSILQHITPSSSSPKSPRENMTSKNPDDIVITLAIRTPLCKAHKGLFKDTPLDYLLYSLLKQVLARSHIDPSLVEDICVGNVSSSKSAYQIRAALLAAGFPVTTSSSSVNRFCSSGLKAIQDIANAIRNGDIECGIAIGAESMTTGGDRLDRPFHDDILNANSDARDCMQPMGQTSETVAREFGVDREAQDRYAADSFAKAEHAQREGWFEDEIVPVRTKVRDPETGVETEVLVTRDEGPRWGTTFEGLSQIKPAFPEFGDRSTGGNSSQVTDGAAVVLLMTRSLAHTLSQPILAKYLTSTTTGLPPRIMGIGPTLAIPKLLSRLSRQYSPSPSTPTLTVNDVDLFEINEAFASMAVYTQRELGIEREKMNPRGGAIALGHPLGCTGVRLVVSGLSELRRRGEGDLGGKVLVVSMCVGTGMGMAGGFISEM
ncbi:MAG: hypothetical protein M1834_006039 [Cirrosporium novae-zelandiae]|nr:MAG: hypothetical protein M1834_006039 [Cirrosporium novae-zelandiae]